MNTPSGALYDLLRIDSGVAAIIGTRIFDGPAPHSVSAVQPYISYRRISKSGPRHLLGPSTLARARYQITCWAPTAAVARDLANKCRLAIDGLRYATIGTIDIVTIAHQGESDGWADPNDDSENVEYYSRCDYMLNYRETIPTFV